MITLRGIYRKHTFWLGAAVLFMLVLLVLDRNNLIERSKLVSRIHDLEAQRDYYRQRISEDSTLLEQLKDTEFLEKYAREKFYFKRDGETIYVIK